ncbi:MAG: ABC transporter permease [Ginsengibacter sp.]
MFKNYFKIAWRNLIRNKTLSFINITGLSVSIAFCLVLFFYIRYEQSYDTFHKKKDHLFRLEMSNTFPSTDTAKKGFFSFLTKNDDVQNQLVFPVIVGASMQNEFPEIRGITRFKDNGDQLVKVNNQTYKEKHFLFADSNFFTTFSFPLLKGNPRNVLSSNNNVVISASLAKKYFGNEDPLGKILELNMDTTLLYTVSGVAEDAPENSSIQYDLIVPITSDPSYQDQIKQGFNEANTLYMIDLANNINYRKFETKMNKWVKDYYTKPYVAEYGQYFKDYDFTNFRWFLRPITDCHYNISQPWGHYTNAKSIYQLSCLVIIILLIAALNYILLVISNAAARSQEIGVRKVLGAKRKSVILQFWTETQLLVIISIAFGLLLLQPLLFLFNHVMDTHIILADFSWKEIVLSLLSLAVLLGILAGYYPALILSKMKPVSIIKSFQTFKINPRFSKIMVIVQYTTCVVLMVAAFVIYLQMRYINNKDLGFDKDQVLMVRNPTWDTEFTRRVRERLNDYANSQPSILSFSGMNGRLDGSYNTNGFKLNGEQKWLKQLTVDYNYFQMLGIKFVAGRPFSPAISSDTSKKTRASIVNETLFKMLGKDAKLGVYNEGLRSTIIGVVKDYNFETLSKKIEPEQHVLVHGFEEYFMFKVRAGEMQNTIANLQKEWKQITNNYPFEYTFLDASISKMYEADQRWQSIIEASCFFAIFIACLGLFGLSSINAVNRTKEIGIRKVLGASMADIVAALSSGFLITFIIAIAIATPIAYWIMKNWLQSFAYRMDLNWWIFIVVGLIAFIIAFITICFRAIKAAKANPVDGLRSE